MWANDLEEGVSNPLMTWSYINFEGLGRQHEKKKKKNVHCVKFLWQL